MSKFGSENPAQNGEAEVHQFITETVSMIEEQLAKTDDPLSQAINGIIAAGGEQSLPVVGIDPEMAAAINEKLEIYCLAKKINSKITLVPVSEEEFAATKAAEEQAPKNIGDLSPEDLDRAAEEFVAQRADSKLLKFILARAERGDVLDEPFRIVISKNLEDQAGLDTISQLLNHYMVKQGWSFRVKFVVEEPKK